MLHFTFMKPRNIAFIATIVACASFLSGCVADETTAQQKTTAFGLYTYEPACFTPNTSCTSMTISTDDATGMELPSGDRTQLFWGLISIEDY